jgi:hypothetical protein
MGGAARTAQLRLRQKKGLSHYIVAGSQWPAASGPPPWGTDTWAVLLKLDAADGDVDFYHPVMDPAPPDHATAVLDVDMVTSGGIGHDGYVVSGLKWQHHIGDRDFDWYQRDLWLMRTDADGNFAWEMRLSFLEGDLSVKKARPGNMAEQHPKNAGRKGSLGKALCPDICHDNHYY